MITLITIFIVAFIAAVIIDSLSRDKREAAQWKREQEASKKADIEAKAADVEVDAEACSCKKPFSHYWNSVAWICLLAPILVIIKYFMG